MKRYLFAAYKAGSSETTLSLGIAKLAYLIWPDEVKIHLEDKDHAQESLTTFASIAGIPTYDIEDANMVITDTGAKAGNLSLEAEKATAIIVPCVPSPIDIAVNQKFVKEEFSKFKKKTFIVWTRVRSNVRLDRDIIAGEGSYAGLFKGFKILNSTVRESAEYRQFVLTGELPKRSKDELSSILLEINR